MTLVALNRTVTHESPAIEVNANLEAGAPGKYVLSVTTTPDQETSEKKGEPPENCTPTTTVDLSASLPSDAETVRIVWDGDELTTVENSDSRPAFRPLEP